MVLSQLIDGFGCMCVREREALQEFCRGRSLWRYTDGPSNESRDGSKAKNRTAEAFM